MLITLRNKKTKRYSQSYIKSGNSEDYLNIYLRVNKNKLILKEIKKALSKFFILNEMKKKSNVSRSLSCSFKKNERTKNEPKYRKKRLKFQRKYQRINKKKIKERHNKNEKILSEFADKHCIVCNKLLNYRTLSGLCTKHRKRKKTNK